MLINISFIFNFKGNLTQMKDEMLNKKIGKRLKELIEEYDKKNYVTAQFLGVNPVTISRYCNGQQTLPLDKAKKLAQKWGIREQYILCASDCKTELELIESYSLNINERDYLFIQLIRKLGYSISFGDNHTTSPAADMSILGDKDESVILNGIKMDILDLQYMLDDIIDYISYILDDPQKYINRRNYYLATEAARNAAKKECRSIDDAINTLKRQFGDDAVSYLRE